MKIKWREHGLILVTTVLVIVIGYYVIDTGNVASKQAAILSRTFAQHHQSFNFYYNLLWPQIGSLLFLYGCYLWINLVILPMMRKDVPNKTGIPLLKTLLIIALQIFVISFLLGPGVNHASFYSNPYYINSVLPIPLTFGYHPQPFANVFGGFGMSIIIVLFYIACLVIRELIIYYYIQKSNYRIMVANELTFSMIFFFSMLVYLSFLNPANNIRMYEFYLGCVAPLLLATITNLLWLFPLKWEGSIFKRRFIGPLLLSGFIHTLIFSIFLREEWSVIRVIEIWALVLLIGTPLSWLNYRQQKNKILQIIGMEKELVKSKIDLQFLRSQINPHFLFNALNTLYGTALLEGSKNTATGIQKLGDMMRFMLHENHQDYIPVAKEIEYLENYIALQKLRMQVSPDIIIEDTITADDCDHQIAPMLLIPFVENAFKHGISITEPSWIRVKLNCNENDVIFEVRNSVYKKSDNDPEKDKSGIGLKNVRERLSLLYPGRHQLNFGRQGGEFVVNLTLKLA